MANRHAGRLADVAKHLLQTEIVAVERPVRYAETHAGSAGYAVTGDAERAVGFGHFLDVAADSPALAASRYHAHLRNLAEPGAPPVCPGSPLLAMCELGRSARYVLCDIDARSVADIDAWADRLGLADRVEALASDGMTAIAARFLDGGQAAGALVHVDPYDPHARVPDGPSALEVAGRLAAAGAAVVYWYGYDRPDDRAWAAATLRAVTADVAWWCSDLLVTRADGTIADDGHLGTATTPGTGFGIVTANVGPTARRRCTDLGDALAAVYAGAALPDGTPGALDHDVTTLSD